MKKYEIAPKKLSGEIKIQPSKSILHRAIICAALCKKGSVSIIKNVNYSDDIMATIESLRNMGLAHIEIFDNEIKVISKNDEKENAIDCNESGSTLRFLIPIMLTMDREFKIIGKERLLMRPLGIYEKLCKEKGFIFEKNKDYIKIKGKLFPGEYFIQGDVSSQFITGMIFALSKLNGNSVINILGKFESKAYVDITMDVLKSFGVSAFYENEKTINIKGIGGFSPCEYTVEGDFSHGAFFIAAGVMNDKIILENLNLDTKQGDKGILDIVQKMGGKINFVNDKIEVLKSDLCGIDIDVSQIPDLVPILAVLACYAKGTTGIYNAKRLKLKESDRLFAVSENLKAIGGNIVQKDDELIIKHSNLIGGNVKSFNDHRIVMSMAIASSLCSSNVIIDEGECVKKSAPLFWNEFSAIGGQYVYR